MPAPLTISKTAGGFPTVFAGSDQALLQERPPRPTRLSLAVIRSTQWTLVDKSDLGRTSVDDRGASFRQRPSRYAQVRSPESRIHNRARSSTDIRGLGCQLGCQRAQQSSAKTIWSRGAPGTVSDDLLKPPVDP